MALVSGGRERTAEEYDRIAAAAGLRPKGAGAPPGDSGEKGDCDFDRVSADGLTAAEFARRWRGAAPVAIATGGLPPAAGGGVAPERCGEWLASLPAQGGGEAGDLPARLGRPFAHAKYGSADAATAPAAGPLGREAPLRRYLFDDGEAWDEDDPWYAFDRGGFFREHAPAVEAAVRGTPVARLHQGATFPFALAAGRRGSGVPFHYHAETSCVLLCGERVWHIYPPG
eukprot:gene8802-61536_t